MWCADCERVEQQVFDRTSLWIHLPTTDSFGKVAALCGSSGYAAEQFNSRGITVRLNRTELSRFLTELYGATNGMERAGTNIVSTEGEEPGAEAIGRVTDLETFINRFQSSWIIDSVEKQRFESFYQPIVMAGSSASAPVSFGHEALFRMRDEQGTVIPPGTVFRMAESAGLLFSLDLVARRSAVEGAAVSGLDGKLFVNFNPSSIYDPAYCLRTTAAAIEELGMRPEDIVFEITETYRMTDKSHMKGILAFYRKAGFGIALDDIGSGWSSLNLLHEFAPDYVKIDMDLCRGVHEHALKQSIVGHLLAMARSAGIRTIAEGVEVEAEAAWLSEAGADYLQGFLFGKPAPGRKPGRGEAHRNVEEATRGLRVAAQL